MTTSEGARPIAVLVVDDDPFVRKALASIIDAEPGFSLVGEAENGSAGVQAAGRLRPDVVLMDIEMPVMNGVDATRRIRSEQGAPEIVILTVRATDEHIVGTLRAGAAGFLLKSSAPEEIVGAVRRAAEGESVLSPQVTSRMIRAFLDRDDGATAREKPDQWREPLTEREQEVAEAVAAGMSNQQIADALFMSLSTAKTNVSRILTKLGLENRVQMALLVNGIIQGPEDVRA